MLTSRYIATNTSEENTAPIFSLEIQFLRVHGRDKLKSHEISLFFLDDHEKIDYELLFSIITLFILTGAF